MLVWDVSGCISMESMLFGWVDGGDWGVGEIRDVKSLEMPANVRRNGYRKHVVRRDGQHK